jgi:hypothetical protein
MLNLKTIVTALVIAQAGGAVMEMFAARHSLSIRSLFWRTGNCYIGAMLQTLKKWVAGHLQSARQFLRNGACSSTLAIHLAQMWQQSSNSIPIAGMLCDELSCSILWQGDPFSCSKTFVKFSCKLCQKERVALLRHSWMDESNMLNECCELHGFCRHTARFHLLSMRSGTDDSE